MMNQLDELWQKMKDTYRILCLSAVHDYILMWSHYADCHRGAVPEFGPVKESNSPFLFARPVTYSATVPVAATLEEFLKFVTGEGPRPDTSIAFQKSVYTKSSAWSYEEEWRILDKVQSSNQKPYFREFYPKELKAIYFGCRMSKESKETIINLISNWGTKVNLFHMRDQRIRFALSTEPQEK